MSENPLPLFYDAEAKRHVPYRVEGNQVLYEPMTFMRLDSGEEATSNFYIRNASMGVIEDLIVQVESVNKPLVEVVLASAEKMPRLEAQGMYRGALRWRAIEGVKAGQCMARVRVSGMLTRE